MNPRRTIVLTGGGTGGHVTPNIALLPYLRQRGYKVYYVGSTDGMEKNLIEPLGIPYYGIDSERLNRYFTLENLTEKWQEFVKKTQALSKETQTSAKSSLDSITTNQILYGISYNTYGKES